MCCSHAGVDLTTLYVQTPYAPCVQVYDMGRDGKRLSRVTSMSMSSVAHLALSALRTNQRNLVSPLVKLSVIPTSESSTLHLLAVTQAGQFVVELFPTITVDYTFSVV